MDAVQKDHWYFVVLIFLHFLKVAVQQKEAVIVRLEEGMVLDCLCPWEGNLSLVSWTKVPDRDPVAVFHPEHELVFSHRYKERIEFLRTSTMDGSISIRNVTHQDIGLYHCSVHTFPQGPWTRSVQVEDLDEPPSEEDSITEPPSPEVTVADRELVVEQNNSVTISCNQEHSGTVSAAHFEKMQLQGQTWDVIGRCKKEEGVLVSEGDSGRRRVSCVDSLDVNLHLTDVVLEDGGLYRCTLETDVGLQTTTVLLTVVTPGGFSLSVYMMYIYFGAGAAGLILFIVILILALRRRKKNRREEYRVKLHPSRRQANIYENVPLCPRITKRSRQINTCPVYANVQTVQSHKPRRQPRDK